MSKRATHALAGRVADELRPRDREALIVLSEVLLERDQRVVGSTGSHTEPWVSIDLYFRPVVGHTSTFRGPVVNAFPGWE